MATNDEQPPPAPINDGAIAEGDDNEEPDEFSVEAIKGKRKNPKTGIVEYLIKWQDYPESANSWEPIDNLSCPELIAKFNETEKSKRKRRSVVENRESQTKRSKKVGEPHVQADNILLEDEVDNISTTETLSSTDSNQREKQKELETAARQPKGFERGLSIETIVGSSFDDDMRLWFFIKWQGMDGLECVEITELEDKAPRALCEWYRERLCHSIKLNSDPTNEELTGQLIS